jgi:hypothetical protein
MVVFYDFVLGNNGSKLSLIAQSNLGAYEFHPLMIDEVDAT